MKSAELEEDGYYWCSHDLGWWIPEGGKYPQKWKVMELKAGELWGAGWEDGTEASSVPGYVEFLGPLPLP